IDFTGKISLHKITNVMGYKTSNISPGGYGDCVWVDYVPCQYADHHEPGEGCPYAGTPGGPKIIITFFDCPPDTGGGGGLAGPAVPVYGAGEGSGSSGGGYGVGGGGSGGSTPGGVTIPIHVELRPEVKFQADLSPEEKSFLENNPDIANEINDFFDNGGSVDFAQQALEVLMNEGDVDFDNLIIFDFTFENNDCLKAVYQEFQQGENSISDYIKNFEPTGSVANLTLQVDDNF